MLRLTFVRYVCAECTAIRATYPVLEIVANAGVIKVTDPVTDASTVSIAMRATKLAVATVTRTLVVERERHVSWGVGLVIRDPTALKVSMHSTVPV